MTLKIVVIKNQFAFQVNDEFGWWSIWALNGVTYAMESLSYILII